MDANKLKVLREIDYTIKKVCLNCVHGVFPQNSWGTCAIQTYEHEKHTGPARQLSIYKTGSCRKHEMQFVADIGAFAEFVESS